MSERKATESSSIVEERRRKNIELLKKIDDQIKRESAINDKNKKKWSDYFPFVR